MNSVAQHAEFRAGGTDFSERRRSGVSGGEVVDIVPSPELTGIRFMPDGSVCIGSLVTIATLAADPRLRDSCPGLAAAAESLATPQIRVVATLGGNLAQRSRCWYFRNPAFACLKKGGDSCPARGGNQLYSVAFDLGRCIAPHPSTLGMACLAYDALITTNRRTGLPIASFFGDGRNGSADNALAPGEMIVSVALPPPRAGERAAYRRVTSRAYAEWPLVEAVVAMEVTSGRIGAARVAAGGVAPVPLRLPQVETALLGEELDASIAAQAAARVASTDAPILNAYKIDLLKRLLVDLLERVTGA